MKITNVRTELLRVPLKQRTITDSQSTVEAVEFLRVGLETDDGIVGWGMNWSYTPGLIAAKVCVDENYAPLLAGTDPEKRKQIVSDCYYSNHFVGRLGASLVGLSAVEFALWDIACKAAGLPLWRYLGPCRERVKAYSTDGGWLSWSEDELVRDTTRLVERGFDAVKIKLGRPDPREDLQRVAAVRRAIGPNVRLMTDVNCAWTLPTAKYWGARLAEHEVFWLEEPMHPFDTRAHAQLAQAISVPVAVGETLYTKTQFRDFIEAGAVQIVQADATKLSGVDEWLEVAALAHAYNLPVVPHTNVQHKLHVQLAAVAPAAMMVENCYESIADIWEEPIAVNDGYYELPQAPGLGLEIRRSVVEETRVA
jgi:L-alanine-DL-glutamate epimerase-like enolase superfamily enzyme